MKINLFETSIYIDNVDCSKIKLQNENFKKTWDSETESSHDFKNSLSEESSIYLLKKMGNLLYGQILKRFELKILSVWQNNYINNDFQEKHMHTSSHFSFIIYKKIKESKTVFFHPVQDLLSSMYPPELFKKTSFFKLNFETKCRENQMVLFPSYLAHMVKKDSNSTTISGNVLIEIKI